MIRYRKGTVEELNGVFPSFSDEFPLEERKTIRQLRTLMEKGDYHLIIAEDTSDDLVKRIGFAFVYMPDNSAFLWLDYLVIEKSHQSKGYGSVFFKELLQLSQTIKVMLMEVEIPSGIDVNQERRVRYYERLGAVKVPLDYWMPTPDGGIQMSLYLSKSDATETLADVNILEIIKRAHGYIHWDNGNLEALFQKISSGRL